MATSKKTGKGRGEGNPNKLGALWLNESEKGVKYMSGVLEDGTRVVVFKNGFKTEEKHPDYIMYRSENAKPYTKPSDTGTEFP